MKHPVIKIIIIGLLLYPLIVPAPGIADGIVLTEAILQRFETTFPELWKLTKQLEEIDKLPDSDEKNAKVQQINAKKEALFKSKGWKDQGEYNDVQSRIVQAMIPLLLLEKFSKMPAAARKSMEDSVNDQLKDFTAAEVAVMKRHIPRLKKMLQDAGLVPKE